MHARLSREEGVSALSETWLAVDEDGDKKEKGTLTNMARMIGHSYQFSNMALEGCLELYTLKNKMASLLTVASHSTYRYKANSIVHLRIRKKNRDYCRYMYIGKGGIYGCMKLCTIKRLGRHD